MFNFLDANYYMYCIKDRLNKETQLVDAELPRKFLVLEISIS